MRPKIFLPILLLALVGCQDEAAETPTPDPEEVGAFDPESPPAEAFFDNLAAQCGAAFPGQLAVAPEGDDMLEGDELLVVHFRHCGDQELRIPFHIEQMDGEWDRSRTWIIRKVDDRLELRHDHREPDGSESEMTQYGGFTETPGNANQQEFRYDMEYADGSVRGWRIIIRPGEEYIYGTIRNGEWTWRVDFDLSEPMEDTPPAPWGH
jgi:hypothetical protein